MTTLELTALSFVFVMIVTSICWFRKPAITRPRYIPTKDGKALREIREKAKEQVCSCGECVFILFLNVTLLLIHTLATQTHPDLDEVWYRTPVDFINGRRFRIESHWSYYTRLSNIMRLRIISRPVTCRPWDRFPSDMWLALDMVFVPVGAAVLFFFSSSFLIAWNFYFPTSVERLIWRIFGLYHAVFVLYGGVYYLIEAIKWHQHRKPRLPVNANQNSTRNVSSRPARHEQCSLDPEGQSTEADHGNGAVQFVVRLFRRFGARAAGWRNISIDNDPEMAIPLRIMVPVTLTCVVYVICRLYLYVEDFLSMRVQPIGIYYTVNEFLPFLGGR
jgi:hypothetical protein